MTFKKKFTSLIILLLVLTLTFGCSNQNNKSDDSKPTTDKSMEDSNFIKDIGKSVTKRSTIVSEEGERFKESDKELDIDEQLEHYKELVKSESDILYKY